MNFLIYPSRDGYVVEARKQNLLFPNYQTPEPYSIGIAEVDRYLENTMVPGNYVLFGAPTGGGKSILAGQISGRAALAGQKVLLLSTETPVYEYEQKIASAFCDMPYDRIIGGSARFDEVFAMQLQFLQLQFESRWKVTKVAMDYNPAMLIREALQSAEDGFTPDVLILDYICPPKVSLETDPDVFHYRKVMSDVSQALKGIAVERNLLAIAFCQIAAAYYQCRAIGPLAVSECKDLARPADAFIGVSHQYDARDNANLYSDEQDFTITKKLRPAQKSFRVWANFAFQRFQDPPVTKSMRPDVPGGNSADSKRTAIVPDSSHRGFVLMRRDRFRKVSELTVANCTNVYFYLLLVATYDGDPEIRGTTFRSSRTIAGNLGLTEKMVRTAIDYLAAGNFIARKKNGRKRIIRISHWESDQDPAKAGYVKLYKNLLDDSRSSLRTDPALLRIWLYCLSEVRALEDSAMQVESGHFLIDCGQMAERISENKERVSSLLNSLEASGRIKIRTLFDGRKEVQVVNWNLYQHQV